MQMDTANRKDTLDIYVQNWIHPRDERTLS